MSLHAEVALVSQLDDDDAMRYVTLAGVSGEVIPSPEIRPVIAFAIDYYGRSGQAPTKVVLMEEFGAVLEDYCREQDVEVGSPVASIEWAVDNLKGTHIAVAHSEAIRVHAQAMAEADPGEQAKVLDQHIVDLMSISRLAERRDRNSDFVEDAEARVVAYISRAEDPGRHQGLTFGMDHIDAYTHGIRPGELAMAAGPPKSGKSFLADRVALSSWRAGEIPVLFTLENDVEMTIDRLLCLEARVSPERWQTGSCTDEEVDRIMKVQEEMEEHPLWVLQPETGKRTATRLVREAAMLNADTLIIDQLSEMEHPEPDSRRGRRDLEVRDILVELRRGINEGRNRIPCLLMHQISRAGAEMARKLGRLEMEHLAESASAERVCDWVFGLHQSSEERMARVSKLQTLAARRADLRHFRLAWDIERGIIDSLETISLSA